MQMVLLVVCGFLVGVFVVSMGGGGGAIYVGLLISLFHVSPAIAASTSLATMVPTTAIGTWSHWKQKNVRFRLGAVMITGGIIGVFIGSYLSNLIPVFWYSKISGAVLLAIAIQLLTTFRKDGKKTERQKSSFSKWTVFFAVSYGLSGGVLSGLVGLSGGGPIVAGLSILGCSMTESVGTSVFVLLGMSTVGFLTHLSMGNVDWPLLAILLIGTTLGAVTGPFILKHFAPDILEKMLKPLTLVLLFIMGLSLII